MLDFLSRFGSNVPWLGNPLVRPGFQPIPGISVIFGGLTMKNGGFNGI
jgi:hypothetical protein